MKISLIFRALIRYWANLASGIIRQRGYPDFSQYLDDFRIAIIGVVNSQFDAESLDEIRASIVHQYIKVAIWADEITDPSFQQLPYQRTIVVFVGDLLP